MNKKKICKRCKLFYEGETCPVCKISDHASSFKGRINIINPQKSMIAEKIDAKVEGEYAIKIG